MRHMQGSSTSLFARPGRTFALLFSHLRALFLLLAAVAYAASPVFAQTANRIVDEVDAGRVQTLPNHHPLWANPGNDAGLLPPDHMLDGMTMVLQRSPQQEQAFEQLLADQQNPASPDYHHWLTPEEIGSRFGLSAQDIAALTAWLQSRGLHVNWVAPSRMFIGFGGTAASLGHAFQTEMHAYRVDGAERISVSSDPLIRKPWPPPSWPFAASTPSRRSRSIASTRCSLIPPSSPMAPCTSLPQRISPPFTTCPATGPV